MRKKIQKSEEKRIYYRRIMRTNQANKIKITENWFVVKDEEL